jgi:hypothetical protein
MINEIVMLFVGFIIGWMLRDRYNVNLKIDKK